MNHRFNRNYIHNEKYNMDTINRIVEYLLNEPLNPAPFDFLFRISSRDYSQDTHDLLTIYFRVFSREKIYKMLNTVTKKDYSKERLPDT